VVREKIGKGERVRIDEIMEKVGSEKGENNGKTGEGRESETGVLGGGLLHESEQAENEKGKKKRASPRRYGGNRQHGVQAQQGTRNQETNAERNEEGERGEGNEQRRGNSG